MRKRCRVEVASGREDDSTANRGPSGARPIASVARRRRGQGAGGLWVAARGAQQVHRTRSGPDKQHRRLTVAGLEQRGGAIASEQRRDDCRVDDPPDERIVAVHLYAEIAPGCDRRHVIERGVRVRQIGRRPQRLEDGRGVAQVPRGP